MKKIAASEAQKSLAVANDLSVVHHLHALLHTMRCIEQHEEQLCTLMHEIRSAGVITEAAGEELRSLLDELPAQAYQSDLDAIGRALEAQQHRDKAKDRKAGQAAQGR